MNKKSESINVSQIGADVTITCKKCGEPITHSNEFGMFCDKECDLEDSKNKAFELINKFFGKSFKL